MDDTMKVVGSVGVIFIRDMILSCFVGIYPHEQEHRQNVVMNSEMWCDLPAAIDTDLIEATVDYEALAIKINKMVEQRKFTLLETLVHAVARLCLTHEPVQRVRFCAEQPSILPFTAGAGIELTLSRD